MTVKYGDTCLHLIKYFAVKYELKSQVKRLQQKLMLNLCLFFVIAFRLKPLRCKMLLLYPCSIQVGFLVLSFYIICSDFKRQENASEALISPCNTKSKIVKILECSHFGNVDKEENAEDLGGSQSSMIL